MSIETVTTRLALMWRNFSTANPTLRIEKAFDELPLILTTNMLPAVLIFPRRATYDFGEFGEEIESETRDYGSVLCVAKAAATNTTELGQVKLMPYIRAVTTYFAARPGLEDDTHVDEPGNRQDVVYRARFTGDTGYLPFQWADGSDPRGPTGGLGIFHAVEFTHEVEEIIAITYVD